MGKFKLAFLGKIHLALTFRTYIYDVPLESNKKFLTSLNLLDRFEIRLGKLQENQNGYHQKQVDILIAIDMIRLALKNRI